MSLNALQHGCTACLESGKESYTDPSGVLHDKNCIYCDGKGYYYALPQVLSIAERYRDELIQVLGLLEHPLIGNWRYMEDGFYRDKSAAAKSIRSLLRLETK